MTEYLINESIPYNNVLVIDEEGTQLGVMNTQTAINKAKEKDLDLVLVGKGGNTPTCKFMNYGKFKFDQMKKEKELKKNQKNIETSEVQISLTIQHNDMKTKANMVKRLIEKGNNVRVVLRLRGREISFVEMAKTKLNEFIGLCSSFSKIKKDVIFEGKDLKIILEKK